MATTPTTSSIDYVNCTCGNHVSSLEHLKSGGADKSSQKRNSQGMDASFVHLPSALGLTANPSRWDGSNSGHDDIVQTLKNSEILLRVCQGRALPEAADDKGISLCIDCLDRAMNSLKVDTERLETECQVYRREMKRREDLDRNSRRSLSTDMFPPSTVEEMHRDVVERAEATFLEEIEVLKAACQQHEQELEQMKSLQKDQHTLTIELNEMEASLAQQQNALQLEARSFDFQQKQHFDKLCQAHRECDDLQAVQLHSTLFDLVIDKRGLRYPLINQLRLAFCPKGDVHWREINAAWSQAAQLLFLIGSSLEFQTPSWRIIPLTTCAKIIHLDHNQKRTVSNLGGQDGRSFARGMASSLRAFNALLDELVRHALSLNVEMPQGGIPFPTTRSSVGGIDLSRLPDADDAGWSRVIQYNACNLQWLSALASQWERQKLSI